MNFGNSNIVLSFLYILALNDERPKNWCETTDKPDELVRI